MKAIFVCAFIAALVLFSGCTTSSRYECPDTADLMYDAESDTYIMGVNCMPSPDRAMDELCLPPGEISTYESWVNENCGIKVKLEIVS